MSQNSNNKPKQNQNNSNTQKSKIINKLAQLESVQSLHKQQQNQNIQIIKCDECNSSISNPQQYPQCMYVHCKLRKPNKLYCHKCSLLNCCRNCNIYLCKLCKIEVKVLLCSFCTNFICSRSCLNKLIQIEKDENYPNPDLMPHLQYQTPRFRKHLDEYSLKKIPFIQCYGKDCKTSKNCGCNENWIACIHCKRFYCKNCCNTHLTKCKLQQCSCYTCCGTKRWGNNCEYCNIKRYKLQAQNENLKKKNNDNLNDNNDKNNENGENDKNDKPDDFSHVQCDLLFCTKGFCDRHIILDLEDSSDDNKNDEDEIDTENNSNDSYNKVENDNNNNVDNDEDEEMIEAE